MSAVQISTKNRRKGERNVGHSTNVSVLQDSLRCVERARSQSRGSERNNSCDGSSVGGPGDCSWGDHHDTSPGQSQFAQPWLRTCEISKHDRGETSTQTVIIVPVILMVLFVGVHLAILGHATHVAQLAAQRGAHIAASANGSVGEIQRAVQQASEVAHELGAHLASPPTLQWNGRTVGLTVHLVTQRLVPFLPTEVSRTVWMAQEAFLKEQER